MTLNIQLLNKPIDDLEFTTRTTNCLKKIGIEYIYQLVTYEEYKLMMIKGLGKRSKKEVINVISSRGLSLNMKIGVDAVDDYKKILTYLGEDFIVTIEKLYTKIKFLNELINFKVKHDKYI